VLLVMFFYCQTGAFAPFGSLRPWAAHGCSEWAEALFFKMAHKEERGSLNGKGCIGMLCMAAAGIGSGFLTMTYPHICLAAAAWRTFMKRIWQTHADATDIS